MDPEHYLSVAEQRRLCAKNIARLQMQAVYGNEKPAKPEPASLIDLAAAAVKAPEQFRSGELLEEIS
ncbi:MAG: hypothetical protein ACRD3Q_08045 [Terriglobales bacterium]